MNEAQAIRERPRTPYQIEQQLYAARRGRDAARKLLAECAAIDMRPFVITRDGQIVYECDLNIPEDIKKFAYDAELAVQKLELEMYEFMRNERRY